MGWGELSHTKCLISSTIFAWNDSHLRRIHRDIITDIHVLFVFGATAPQWAMASSFTSFLDHTQRRIAVGRTPLDEWSARPRDLYLTTHNTHNRHILVPGGIRTRNLSRRAAADPRHRPRGFWDRQVFMYSRGQLKCDGTRAGTRFRLSSKRTIPFKSARGASVQSTTDSRVVRISGSNAGYTTFRGSVKGTCYPLHSPVSPSLPLPCATVCHHISTGVYRLFLPDLIEFKFPRLSRNRQTSDFHEHASSRSQAVPCRQTKERRDMTKLTVVFFSVILRTGPKNAKITCAIEWPQLVWKWQSEACLTFAFEECADADERRNTIKL